MLLDFVCVCVWAYVRDVFSDKNKSVRISESILLSSDNCMPSRRLKAMYNTVRLTQESWIYEAHKSTFRQFFLMPHCCLATQRLKFNCAVVVHVDSELCVPA